VLRPAQARGVNWDPISWAALDERPPVEPTIGGLIYPGRRHIFSGPPESAKTWAAFCIALEEIRAGGVVLHVDFEMFAYETRDRLREILRHEPPSDAEVAEARGILERSGARDYTRTRARAYRDEALAQLESAGIIDGEAMDRLRLIVLSAISA
jgi:hypothetical protein